MEFDVNKLEKKALSKTKVDKFDFSSEEINFMANIFNTIINSENYDSTIDYLAGIYGVSISTIKFIRNIYYSHFASKEEKMIYSNKIQEIRNLKRKRGFIDFSIVSLFTFFMGIIGITLALIMYN